MTNLYLCTEREEGVDYFKWGITNQSTARKRSSNYVETHRFEESFSAKGAEALICDIVYQISPEYQYKCGQGRTPWTERVEADFPFDLLLEIWDWVHEIIELKAVNPDQYKKLAPKFALKEGCDFNYEMLPMKRFGHKLIQEWRERFTAYHYAQAQKPQMPEPMWA